MIGPIGLKGKKRKTLPQTRDYKDEDFYQPAAEPNRSGTSLPWLAYILPVGVFILSKVVTEALGLSAGSKGLVDIVMVIFITTGLLTYCANINKKEN